ncbi:MAG: GNAT family N-acetyltransferase [Gemmatimonadales bacterium]
MIVTPQTLEGRHVRLEPLTLDHLGGLAMVGLDPELWRLTTTRISGPPDLERYVADALAEQRAGTALPFATVWRKTGEIIGSTRFGNVAPSHRRVEIGWTWLGRQWQRTGANTEAKYLMLCHAFEVWGCRRVEFKTSTLNQRSRAAIRRLGAVEEGVLRCHMINDDGSRRDSVYYSIIADEWPDTRRHLERLLTGHESG